MYFPDDPLFPYDPIFNSVRDEGGRERTDRPLLHHGTKPNWAPPRVRHRAARPRVDAVRGGTLIFKTTPSQTVGPFFAIGLHWAEGPAP